MDDHGLRYAKPMKLGFDELEWLQREHNERARHSRLVGLRTPGLLLDTVQGSDLRTAWRVADDDDDGTVSIAPPTNGLAGLIDADGYLVILREAGALEIPDDGTWYTLVVRRKVDDYERGTLILTTGSTTVQGVGTEFTRYKGFTGDAVGDLKRGTRLRIDASDTGNGNAGTLVVDTVVDDTNLTLTAAPAGSTESGVRFTVAGEFAGPTPAEPDIHLRIVPEFELVARTRVPADGDLVLYDVMRDSGNVPQVTLIDRRHANVSRERHERGITALVPKTEYADAAPYLAASLHVDTVYTPPGGQSAQTFAVAPGSGSDGSSAGPNLVMVAVLSGGSLECRQQTRDLRTWTAGGQVEASGVSTGYLSGCALAQLPRGSGNTHMAVWLAGAVNTFVRRFSADDGDTWGTSAVIWDATVIDPSDQVLSPHLLLTRRGRLILFAGYFHFARTTNRYSLRYIYSDDYGATWATNGHAGFPIVDLPASGTYQSAYRPHAVQDLNGTIWTVYEYENPTQRIGLVRSATEDLPDPASTADPGHEIGDGTNDKKDPCLWASPDGNLVCLYTSFAATNTRVNAALITARNDGTGAITRPIHSTMSRLWTVQTGAGVGEIELAIGQSRSLPLAFYIDPVPADDPIKQVPLLPIRVPILGYIE